MLHHKAVDDDFYCMAQVFVKGDIVSEVVEDTVGADSCVAVFLGVCEDFFMSAFFSADNRRENHEPLPLGELHYFVNDGVLRGLANLLTADGAMRNSETCIKQAEIVIDFGDSADSRARVF